MGSGSTVDPHTNWKNQMTDVTTLDEELSKINIDHVDLITMDIEGAEIEAVKGCINTIKNNPKINLAIASYHQVNGHQTAPTIEELFQQYGLKAKTEFPRHLTTYGSH